MALLLGLLALGGPSGARAQTPRDDLVAHANRSVAQSGATKEASEVLFPALAAMERPPERFRSGVHDRIHGPSLRETRAASVVTPKDPDWAALSAWAAAPAQQAVLAAIKTITDPSARFVLGFPYGRAGVKPEWAGAGLYVGLGSPQLLAAANGSMEYLFRLSEAATLCSVEAQRRAAAGEGSAAVEPLIGWLRMGRMVSDRLFSMEKQWGMQSVRDAAERMLDISCQHPGLLSAQDIAQAVLELDLRALAPERILFPDGERLACLQLIGLTMEERGGPSATGFAPTMGLIRAEPTGLAAFGGAAYWAQFQGEHAGWFDSIEEVRKVFGDWGQRWQINNQFDPIWQQLTDFSKMDARRFAIIREVVASEPVNIESLFQLRVELMVQLTGARSALGVVGFRARQNTWPPALAAVQPQFVPRLDFDPWSWNERRETRDIFQFFVPMRDQKRGPREEPTPHRMRVRIGGDAGTDLVAAAGAELAAAMPAEMREQLRSAFASGLPADVVDESGRPSADKLKAIAEQNINASPDLTQEQKQALIGSFRGLNQALIDQVFEILRAAVGMAGETDMHTAELRDDTFVLYSVGFNQKADFARVVGRGGEDIIIWPPLLWLEREYARGGAGQ
ncbi:MAG TPA: hypothetical protein DEB06_04050 [Phycisphaerales bacterium]|nr:hypothetical protein [Phycisphaerales bacterium]